MKIFYRMSFLTLLAISSFALAGDSHEIPPPPTLIVVKDLGGVSALPYFESVGLQRPTAAQRVAPLDPPPAPQLRYSEVDLLPVQSAQLTPGRITYRSIHMPGLTPIFMIGNDPQSREWLKARLSRLQALRAVGFVVNVDTPKDLQSLRELAPGLALVPNSGDDLSTRLNLKHYPALITATGIEQ